MFKTRLNLLPYRGFSLKRKGSSLFFWVQKTTQENNPSFFYLLTFTWFNGSGKFAFP